MLLSIDERDPRPIYSQLAAQVREQVANGHLRPGDELPPVRELAASLGIHLHTVRHAYHELRDEGLIELPLGRRARIANRRRPGATPDEVDRRLSRRVNDLVTDALNFGLDRKDVLQLVRRSLDARAPRESPK